MEQITKPHCGARLDRLPDCRWHSSMFAIVAFGLLVCWSNAVGGLILAHLKALGWTDNSTTATFSAITTAGMFLGSRILLYRRRVKFCAIMGALNISTVKIKTVAIPFTSG